MADQQTSPSQGFGGSEVKRLGFNLYLKMPENRMECRCSYVPHDQGSMMTRDELSGFLKQYNVREGLDQKAFDDFAIKAAAGQQQVDVLLASGTPPVDGADACIALKVQPSTLLHQGDDAATQVDMYIVQTFINVSAGDEIGRIMPEEPGTPGRNVVGLPVPPLPGKPLKIKIGKNIRVEDNGTLLIAEATGRFCQTADEISVEEEYVVAGDVNFRIGSINFRGVVDVRGDVLDNFDIVASKGLRVSGNIGACNINSDGDITFCGMDGQERGKIVCGGTLRAHFIHDTAVECAGDVIVDVEIHNCTIKTLGRIVVDKGAISGGSCIALGGIESKKIGSPASVRTWLRVGVDYRDIAELDSLTSELAENSARAAMSQDLSEISVLREARGTLTDRIMAIRARSEGVANAKVNVKSALYDKVILCLGAVTEDIVDQKNGPLSVIENRVDGGLYFLPMTGLNVRAVDMELALIREQKNM